MGGGNCDFLRDLVLAEGGADAFAAAAFLDRVLFAGALLDAGGAVCDDDCRHTCCRIGANLMAVWGVCVWLLLFWSAAVGTLCTGCVSFVMARVKQRELLPVSMCAHGTG